VPLPYAGGSWVVWERDAGPVQSAALDTDLPLRVVAAGEPVPLAAGRRALGWWLTGTGRAMLGMAREHALDRVQFGRPLASFQAVRHRLAETLVALEGAEATLLAAEDDLGSLLAKAAAGQAALTAARHCQQVLGGIGFTAEHGLHRHVRRALVLDGLLGSAWELTREAGAILRRECSVPRLVGL
jgi:alkylation response protein AidB-like acyl-CoA dehydrogenase